MSIRAGLFSNTAYIFGLAIHSVRVAESISCRRYGDLEAVEDFIAVGKDVNVVWSFLAKILMPQLHCLALGTITMHLFERLVRHLLLLLLAQSSWVPQYCVGSD